jgi:hypothetical protein
MDRESRSGRTPGTFREDLTLAISMNPLLSPVEPLKVDYDRERFEDIGYMTCMLVGRWPIHHTMSRCIWPGLS